MISVIIPSFHDPYLVPTIRAVLRHATEAIEVIAVLDGYWRADVPDDPRVKTVHLGATRGMREAINAGVRVAQGDVLMRLDEHVDVSPGFDTVLTAALEPGVIVTPRHYALDPTTWTRTADPAIDYCRLVIDVTHRKFTGKPWRSRTRERQDVARDENMAFQGSCWMMLRSHWDTVIGDLQTLGYGPHYQDSVEMSFKTWQAGGRILTEKRAWYAHRHRRFPRTHRYGGAEARAGWAYALALWEPYYRAVVAPRWGLA